MPRERDSLKLEEKQIATIGSFCLNEECEDYQKVNHGNMIKHGKTDTDVQRYRCKTCKKAFVETKGKPIYGDPDQLKALLGEHTAYVERTRSLITTDEWTVSS
jgi:transposase-like protein